MTQQEKELLLKDLCARLPYGVKGIYTKNGFTEPYDSVLTPFYYGEVEMSLEGARAKKNYVEFKPYLRPMSSMTEEEEKVFNDFLEFQAEYVSDADLDNKTDMFDWFLSRHLDFRGLIPMGLAIEATEGMYKTE